jgi:hypothetical protein
VKRYSDILNNPAGRSAEEIRHAHIGLGSTAAALTAAAKTQSEIDTAAKDSPFGQVRAAQITAGLTEQWQATHKGVPLPDAWKMTKDSTPEDFARVDKILTNTVTESATAAQRETANAIREQTIALTRAHGAPEGNTDLTGDAYVASLPKPTQALVREMTGGQITGKRVDQLLARNPALMAEVALADPNISTSKLTSYPEAYEKFTSGSISKSLTSGRTLLDHLGEASDINLSGGLSGAADRYNPHSKLAKSYNQLLGQIASEQCQFYGESPTEQNLKNRRDNLALGINTEASLKEAARNMGDKVEEYRKQWDDARPSNRFQDPMPNDLSATARRAQQFLDDRYQRGGEREHQTAGLGLNTRQPAPQAAPQNAPAAAPKSGGFFDNQTGVKRQGQ